MIDTNTLPEHITADQVTTVTIAQLTETPAGGTRWVIGTIAEHADEGKIADTFQADVKGRFGFIADDADWTARVAQVLAAHDWKAVDTIAYDDDIELTRA